MKITTFNPFVVTEQVDDTIKLFEALGFERRHTKEGIEIADRTDTVIRMKDANGFYLDVLQSEAEAARDTVGIRINVDDFDEGVSYFEARGYSVFGEAHETDSSVTALMTNGDGSYLVIFHHKKNNK